MVKSRYIPSNARKWDRDRTRSGQIFRRSQFFASHNPMASGRDWCLTLHNPREGWQEILEKDEHFKYFVGQTEVCPETKKEHIQAYVEFKNTVRLSKLQIIWGPGNHFEKRKGTRDQARDYCMKEDSRAPEAVPYEIGAWEPSKGQGKRTDLQDACAIVKNEGIKRMIDEKPDMFVKYHSGMGKYEQHCAAQRVSKWRDVHVTVLWGESGSGKTRFVWDNEDDVFSLTTYGKGKTWFQGYSGQKVLLIDDFCGQIDFQELLRILDGHPLTIENKGGSAIAEWTKVYITSNQRVTDWYSGGNVHMPALERRIKVIKEMKK